MCVKDKDKKEMPIFPSLKALTNKICQEFFIDQMTPDQAAHHRTAIFKILLTHQGIAAQQVVDYQREITRQIHVLGCKLHTHEPADDGRIF